MSIEGPVRVPPPRRYTLSWCAGLAAAANNTTLFVEFINELLQIVAMRSVNGFEGGD